MPDVLIYGDTIRTPELRHEVPVAIPDPFLYAEKDDRRIAVLHSLEIPRVRQDAPALEIMPLEQLGSDELFTRGLQGWEVMLELAVDRDLFDNRRRSKNETELRGIRNAQKACEAALDVSRELLRRAKPNGAGLEVDGQPLTCERLKRVIEDVFADHEVEGSDMIVAHGPQTAVGHDMGSGQIATNEPIGRASCRERVS